MSSVLPVGCCMYVSLAILTFAFDATAPGLRAASSWSPGKRHRQLKCLGPLAYQVVLRTGLESR